MNRNGDLESPSNHKLTPKQRAFADFFLEDLNATRAAIRAGYSQIGARVSGHRNLKRKNVRDYINIRQQELKELNLISETEYVRQIKSVCSYDVGRVFNLVDGKFTLKPFREIWQWDLDAIKSISIRTITKILPDGSREVNQELVVEFYDKLQALTLLGRALGYF